MKEAADAKLHMNHDAQAGSSSGNLVYRFLWKNKITIGLFLLIFIVISFVAPEFYNISNISSVARQASITGIVALGMSFVILTGGIDLSVGSLLSLTGVSFAYLLSGGTPLWLALILALAIGLVYGLVNAIGVTLFGIQPFIMTLATMAIGGGVTLVICEGTAIAFRLNSPSLETIFNGTIAGIPGPAIIFFIGTIVSAFILRYLPFGRFVYGVGGSQETARFSGVRTTRVLWIVYSIAGLCAALAGVIQASQLTIGDPNAGRFVMLDSIAAVVIGGTRLSGGKGTIGGTVAGVLLLGIVSNLMNLTGVSPFHQDIVKGLIIVVAIVIASSGLRQRIKQQWADL